MQMSLVDLAITKTQGLLAIPSPSSYTCEVTDDIMDQLQAMGFSPVKTRKGCVVCTLGGEGRGIALAAHVDTLGLMVKKISASGSLKFTRIGGPSLNSLETEGVTVRTREGKQYTGTVQMQNASVHVNGKIGEQKRDEDSLEILLDEEVYSAADTKNLGIEGGDVVFIDPRTVITPSGYIKSRFLDDKLSSGMLLALAQAVADGEVKLARETSIFFSVYEEVGHGASAGLPENIEDLLVVDMGCVGDGLACRETQVSICAKDSAGPYDYAMTSELIALSKKEAIDYAVDVYPFYSSDSATALRSGMDIRCALIGSGVYASHGYERTHRKGVENTMRLIVSYLRA